MELILDFVECHDRAGLCPCHGCEMKQSGQQAIEFRAVWEARRAFERSLEYDPDYLPARKALQLIREQGLREL